MADFVFNYVFSKVLRVFLCLPGLPVAVKLADRYLGLAPKANIIRSASADRLKGTNYGHWDKRLLTT